MSTEHISGAAMSTASTFVPDGSSGPQVRTTLTGRPIKYEHDTFSNMMTDGSFGDGMSGANLLPPGYTDSSLVHIPIKVGEYLSPTRSPSIGNDVKREQPRKGSVWSRISHTVSGDSKGKTEDGLRIVQMSRGDYLKYWAKGEDGEFREGVVEPPEGRAEWLCRALEKQGAAK